MPLTHELPADFNTITLTLHRRLSLVEAGQAAGALGYALRKMNGESLGEPTSVILGEKTVLSFFFDSTKCFRSTYSFEEAFEAAAGYIMAGTPVRTTNRAGVGTAGTRLVKGIGTVSLQIALDGLTVLDTATPVATFQRVNVDGTVDVVPLPSEGNRRYEALRAALGDTWIDRYPEAYHGLTTHEVWHLDDWQGEPTNRVAQRLAGIGHDLRGPVLLVPLAEPNHAERAHQERFFDRVFAALAGLNDDVVIVVPFDDSAA